MHDGIVCSEKIYDMKKKLHFAISCYLFIKKACIISLY